MPLEVKVFDRYWQELSNEETRLENNQVIVYKKRAHYPGGSLVLIDGYCVARMETFQRKYNPKLLGGRDICQKAIFWQKDLALVFAKLLACGDIDTLETLAKKGDLPCKG